MHSNNAKTVTVVTDFRLLLLSSLQQSTQQKQHNNQQLTINMGSVISRISPTDGDDRWELLVSPQYIVITDVLNLNEKELIVIGRVGNTRTHKIFKVDGAKNTCEDLQIDFDYTIRASFVDTVQQKLYIFANVTGFIYDLSGQPGTSNITIDGSVYPYHGLVYLFEFPHHSLVQMVVVGDSVYVSMMGQLKWVWTNFRDTKSGVEWIRTPKTASCVCSCLFVVGTGILRIFDRSGIIHDLNPKTDQDKIVAGLWGPMTRICRIGHQERQVMPAATIATHCGRYIISFGQPDIFIFDTVKRTICLSAISAPRPDGPVGNAFDAYKTFAAYQRYYSDEQIITQHFVDGIVDSIYSIGGADGNHNQVCPRCLVALIAQYVVFEWVQFISRNFQHWRINLTQVFKKTVVYQAEKCEKCAFC